MRWENVGVFPQSFISCRQRQLEGRKALRNLRKLTGAVDRTGSFEIEMHWRSRQDTSPYNEDGVISAPRLVYSVNGYNAWTG